MKFEKMKKIFFDNIECDDDLYDRVDVLSTLTGEQENVLMIATFFHNVIESLYKVSCEVEGEETDDLNFTSLVMAAVTSHKSVSAIFRSDKGLK